jgi:hypothetical protein
MSIHERIWENLAGDLEYHPKRGLLYLALGTTSLCFWICAPADNKLTATPLVFGTGSVTLFLKGVFLLRKSSEGLGLTERELAQLSDPSARKALPTISALAAQIVQDFGAGAMLLGPFLHSLKNINQTWEPPSLQVFLTGAVLFFIGWLIHRERQRSEKAT